MEKIDIIIVSHNNKDILGTCLDSINKQSYENHEIYLLDNDSTDGTKKFIKKNYPKINFFDMPKKGPSEKRNLGISMSSSKYIVVMDSDAVLTKDWLKQAVNYMESHKDVGLCNGKILGKEGLIDSAGGIIAKNGGGTDIGALQKDSGQFDYFKRAAFLKSASLIIRRKMVKEIGDFDPDYFFGCEDSDLGLRANISGWKVIYNSDLVSYHLSHQTMKKLSNKNECFITHRNKILTLLKNFELKTLILYSPLLIFSFFISLCLKKHRLQMIKGYLWNLIYLRRTLEKRRKIQAKRKISDNELFDILEFPLLIRSMGKSKSKYIKFLKKIKTKKMRSITFFITTNCNSKCKHCFYWKNLNNTKDLSLKQIETVLSNFQDIDSILLSGGEPFIREDLLKIIDIIVKYNHPKLISIPSNGLLGEKIMSDMEAMLKKYPNINFAVNLSLDGTKRYHDYIRGVKGNFKKTIDLSQKLIGLKKRYSNFQSVAVNTVITKENYKDLPKVIALAKKLKVHEHFFDIIRGQHQGILSVPELGDLKKINTLRYNARKYYNLRKHKNPIKRFLVNLRERHIIITQTEVLMNKKWPFKCVAGVNDMIVESDGTARICELTPKIGSLLENSSEELLKSEQAKKIFKVIENHRCDCTHVCNVSSSMAHSFKDFFLTRPIIDFFKKFRYFN